MKFLRLLFFVVLTLVILVIAGAYVAIQFIDIKQVKELVQARVEEETGRKLTIKGEVKPTIGFMPTVAISDVTLSNPDWAKAPDMISIANLRVTLELKPLLHGIMRVSEVELDGAQIMLEKKNEQSSWQFKKSQENKADKKEEKKAAKEKDGKGFSGGLTIAHLKITNSTLDYRDEISGAHHLLAIEKLDIADLTPHGIGQLSMTGTYNEAAIHIAGSLSEDNLMLIDVAMQKNSMSLAAKGSLALEDMTFDLAADLDTPKLSDLLAVAGIPSTNQTPLHVNTALGGTSEMISFSKTELEYGDLKAKGSGRVNLSGKKPHIQADFTLPVIDMRSAVAATGEGGKTSATHSATPAASLIPDIEIQASGLDAVNADIHLKAEKINLEKTTLTNAEATAELNDAKLSIEPFAFNTSQGTVKGSLSVNAGAAPPAVSADIITNDMVLGKLLQEMAGESAIEGGIVKSALKLSGSGKTLQAVLAHANGNLDFYMDKAVYHTPVAGNKTRAFLDLVQGPGTQRDRINISCGIGRFTIAQGVAKSDILALKTDVALMTGDGFVHLSDTTVDMLLKARSTKPGVSALVVPLRVKGRIDSPAVMPDADAALKAVGALALGLAGEEKMPGWLSSGQEGNQLTLSAEDNACVKDILAAQSQPQQTPKEQYKQLEDAVAGQRDVLKGNLKQLKQDAKPLRDELKGLFKKKKD